MAPQPLFNLHQLQVLLAIVDAGSFTAAAKRLNRATSVVTYTIKTLEAQLGVPLFHRTGARGATLTKEGEAVVAEARSLTYGADRFRARVKGLTEGLESEVSLVVDEMFPAERLNAVLGSFEEKFPSVSVRLYSEVMGGIEHLIRTGQCNLGLGGMVHMSGDGLAQHQIKGVAVIPVAAADHALAKCNSSNLEIARKHLQIVTTERYGEKKISFGIFGERVWRVTNQSAKHALLRAGIGWGGMPEPMVREDLQAGRLVRLSLADWIGGEYALQVAYKDDAPPGPATRWLIKQFFMGSEDRAPESHDPEPKTGILLRS